MPSRKPSQDQSPRHTASPPSRNRLYPILDHSFSENDEGDESWELSSGDNVTTTTFDSSAYMHSSLLDSSQELSRSGIHPSSEARLRSGRAFRSSASSDESPVKIQKRQRSTATNAPGVNPLLVAAIIAVIVLSVLFFIFSIFSSNNREENLSHPGLYDQFKTKMSLLKSKFPSQSTKSWKVLSVATKHILVERDPVYPAVVMMVGGGNALPVMSCISKQLIAMLNDIYNISSPNGQLFDIKVPELNNRSPSLEKLDLDQRLQKVFSGGYKGAMLTNVEKLSPEAALMLHSYCDNDHAPFKNILLVLEVVSETSDFEQSDLAKSVEKYLRNLWEEELGIDKVMALLSRIGNNVMSVNEESSNVMSNANC